MEKVSRDAYERLEDQCNTAEQKYDDVEMRLHRVADDIMALEEALEEHTAARKAYAEHPTSENQVELAKAEGRLIGRSNIVTTVFRAHFGDDFL